MIIYRNGLFVESDVPGMDAFMDSVHSSDGVFETIRVKGGRPEHLNLHIERLAEGAAAVKSELPGVDFAGLIDELLNRRPELGGGGRLRLIVLRAMDRRPDLCATLEPYTPPGPEDYRDGVKLISAGHPYEGSFLSRIKTTKRREYSMLREFSRAKGCHDCLLTDRRGVISETTTGNVFIISGGELFVPPYDSCRLKGVMERVVSEKLLREGVKISEKEFRSKDMTAATGMFITNSLVGLLPVGMLNKSALADVYSSKRIKELAAELAPG